MPLSGIELVHAELNRGSEVQPVLVVVSFQQSGLHIGENGNRKGAGK